jgi:DNA-binding PadR family transcriptional regulator
MHDRIVLFYIIRYPSMRRHWFFILLSLADRDRHGSGVMRDVLELTEGELKLWPVTLYGSLDELRDHGWIRALEGPPAGAENDSARRRWFRITPAGRRALATEVGRLDATVRIASRRLAHSGDSP